MNRASVRSFLITILFMAGMSYAQDARLTGLVTDPSGSVLVNVKITAIQAERNVVFTTQTDNTGRYLFPKLPIGHYDVKAECAGFKIFLQPDLNLTTNMDALLSIGMELGNVQEQVTVSAEASRVSTETVTLQQLVDSRRIVDLPLNGRDVYQLARLVPGTGESGTNIGGGRSGSQNNNMTNISVDGTLNVDMSFGIIQPAPSPDAVQEFAIQTSTPPAQYGMASGVIEFSTKSGTNELHGTLYEFLRNDKLDARSFFLRDKTRRKRNQYGFAGGGPVWLPSVYDGRNRTFWFVNLEQQKEPLGAPVTLTAPTDGELRGDFSASSRTITDPSARRPFPNNQIPQSRIDPLALNFMREYVPQPQDARGTYRYQRPNDNNPSQVLLRGDQVIGGGRHQVNGRLFLTRQSSPQSGGNLPAFQGGTLRQETDLYGLNYTWLVSPNKINTFRFGFNDLYTDPDYQPKLELADLQKLGFSKNYYMYIPGFPNISVSGYFNTSMVKTTRDFNTFSWSDDFSWIHGRHTVKLGTWGIRVNQNALNFARTNGEFTFNGSFSGLGLSDFMLGVPIQFRQQNPATNVPRGLHLSWFVQDDIKVNRRLTMNLGLRYELPLPTVMDNDAAMVYSPGAQSGVFQNAPPNVLFPGDPGVPRAGRTAAKTLFGPRAGIAYVLTSDQKTILRTGYGIYYNPSWANIIGQFSIKQPFVRLVTLASPPSTAYPWADFPGGNPHPYTPGAQAVFDPQIEGLAFGPNFRELGMQQWNVSVQREIARNWLVTAAYVGTRGTHIPYLRDINAPVYIPGASSIANINQRRPMYPYFGVFDLFESVVNSSYNSAQFSVDKRFSRGFSVMLSYTFSKALHDLNSTLTASQSQDPNNRGPEWSPADFDRTHAFVTSWVWQVPSGRLRRGVAGVLFSGWDLNGIWSMYSGAPMQVTASRDRALRAHPNRPDRLRDARLPTERPRAQLIEEYFDTGAYVPNKDGEFGNAPRAEGQLKAPGAINVTLGINKNFRGFLESHRLQFRAELFNAINRPNFDRPAANIDSPSTFGRILSAADGRIIQFGLKYLF